VPRRATRNGRRIRWAGGGLLLAAALPFLQTQLEGLNLRFEVLLLTSAMILGVTLLATVLQEHRTTRQAEEELDDSLDVMLACWPPRPAARLTPYDVGVHPELAADPESRAYVPRDRDGEIDAAIREVGIVVVFGPAGSGKSRSAFEAVGRTAPDAGMIVPADADGLKELMQQARKLPLFEEPAVLWLDGLDRFAEALDMDPIDALVHPAPRRRGTAEPPRLRVVATIRDGDLQKLLGEGEEPAADAAVQRLAAHSRGVALDAGLSDPEIARFEERRGQPPGGGTVAEAFPRSWSEGWSRPVEHEPLRDGRSNPFPVVVGILLAALVGCALALAWFVDDKGWTVPPPLDEQVAKIADGVQACQSLHELPKDGKGLKEGGDPNRAILVAVVRGGDCGTSDEVRFYRLDDKRLERIATLVPPTGAARQTFSCIADTDRKADEECRVVLSGSGGVLAGAFRNVQTGQELPLLISFADRQLKVLALGPPAPPPDDLPTDVRALGTEPVSLDLRAGSEGTAPAPCWPGVRNCLKARTAAVTAVVGAEGDQPPVLVAGHVARGTSDAPERLAVTAWRISAGPEAAPAAQANRDCLVLLKGAPQKLRQKVEDVDARDVLLETARPAGAQLMC
jgi:hypothetical protein